MKNIDYIHHWRKNMVHHRLSLFLHLLLLFLVLFLGFQNVYGKFNKEGFLYAYMVSILLFAVPIYLNLYFFVPRFLDKHRLQHFLISFFVSILITTIVGMASLYPLHQQYGISDFCLQDGRPFSFQGIVHSILVLVLIVSGCISFVLFRRWIIYGKRIMELEKATMQAELQQLKNQINPHFLFNMLNNANILVQEAPEEASRLLIRLDDLLQYQFHDSTCKEVVLRDDIQFLTSFLELEKVRRDHFEYLVSIDGDVNAVRVPPLLFIPFVENAVKHNPDSNNLSYVHLYFIVRDEELIFRCDNSKPRIPVKKDGGLGLVNIRRRLDLLYGAGYALQIEDLETTYSVNLHLKL